MIFIFFSIYNKLTLPRVKFGSISLPEKSFLFAVKTASQSRLWGMFFATQLPKMRLKYNIIQFRLAYQIRNHGCQFGTVQKTDSAVRKIGSLEA